ncbi:MAG TPA: site-2 protease family protein [Actinomycetota bacterium]
MFGRSWRIGRIGGVEIRVDPSWLVIVVLVAYSLFLQFTFAYRGLSTGAGLALAAGAAILFFGSVLAHEMTHAVTARRMGIPVRDITLFVFGGATEANVDAQGPRKEFVVSVVGPLSSLALGGLLWAASVLGRSVLSPPEAGALGYLGWINVILAGFNLLPGFPLDGGRILRSAIWGATGSLRLATRVATLAGQAVGYLLLATGLFLVFGGDLVGGVWFAAIGWFLAATARASYRQFEIRARMRASDVEDVMEEGLDAVPADITLQDAVDEHVLRRRQEVFPVSEDGRTVGALTVAAIRHVPRGDWERRTVRDCMVPMSGLGVVPPHARLEEVLDRLEESPTGVVLVMQGGEVMGVVTADGLTGWLRRRSLAA